MEGITKLVFASGLFIGALVVFIAGSFAPYALAGAFIAAITLVVRGVVEHDRFWTEWHGTPPAKSLKSGDPL